MAMPPVDDALRKTIDNTRRALLAAREPGGWWTGELSSSALSTATAAFALHLFCDRAKSETELTNVAACHKAGDAGRAWLARNQNSDRGFGDTTLSVSNISTTALCWAALAADSSTRSAVIAEAAQRAEHWLADRAGGVDPDHLVPAIIARYGKDKTFSVPILTMCALAGRLGDGLGAWKKCTAASLRVGGVSAARLQVAAIAGRQFHAALAADRDRSRPASTQAEPQSCRASDSQYRSRAHVESAEADPASQRRVPRSHAPHQFRLHHSELDRAPGAKLIIRSFTGGSNFSSIPRGRMEAGRSIQIWQRG